jgi:hypothetical protein
MCLEDNVRVEAEIEMPDRLKSLPTHGGYPVPFLVMRSNDGVPDFRVTDMERWWDSVNKNLCSLCGQPNDYWLYFIGGPISINDTRLFFDPATHHECALYALKVCPYLAGVRDRSERPVKIDNAEIKIHPPEFHNPHKPDSFGLGRTRGYKLVMEQGKQLVKAHPWASVSWWKDGRILHV